MTSSNMSCDTCGGALDIKAVISNTTVCQSCLQESSASSALYTIIDGKRSFHKHIQACQYGGSCEECNFH